MRIIEQFEHSDEHKLFLKKESLVRPEYFFRPYGVHGMLHAKRVLLIAMILAKVDGLTERERNILALCSIYHDIGRKHDGYCTKHGRYSYIKAKKLGLLDGYSKEDLAIAEFIIEEHCIDDDRAKVKLAAYQGADTAAMGKLYNYFCDCDSLDRVRLGWLYKLDESYLRTVAARKIVPLTHEIYNNWDDIYARLREAYCEIAK